MKEAKQKVEKPKEFSIEDISPRGCEIEVEVDGVAKRYALRKWNLLAMIWSRKEWGSEEAFQDALNAKSEINVKTSTGAYIEALCKSLHFLLEDKSDFPKWEDFAVQCAAGPVQIIQLGNALDVVMGMSQPIGEKQMAEAKKKINKAVNEKLAGTK